MPAETPGGEHTLEAECPHCGARFPASPALLGHTGPCAVCKQDFTIGAAPTGKGRPALPQQTPGVPIPPLPPKPPVLPPEARAVPVPPPAPQPAAKPPASQPTRGGLPPPVIAPEMRATPQEVLPTTQMLPIADMNVKAGLAIWAATTLLMIVFSYISSAVGLAAGLFVLALAFAGYALGTAQALHGGHKWIAVNTADPTERRLYSILQSAASKAGLPAPRLALDRETTDINAWTYGLSTDSAFVVVTQSFLDHVKPTDGELEAVFAHELGHVKYGDFVIATLLRFPIWLIDKIRWLMALARYVAGGVLRVSAEVAGGCGCVGLFVILGLLFLVLYLSMIMAVMGAMIFVGMLFLNAFGREREYLADMHSAQVMRTARPLQSGLAKLEQAMLRVKSELEQRAANTQEGQEIDTNVAAPAAAFDSEGFIGEALSARPSLWEAIRSGEFLQTHPSTKSRVYFLLHPGERRQLWSRAQDWLEARAAGFIAYSPKAGQPQSLALPLGLGLALGAATALVTRYYDRWPAEVALLLAMAVVGYLVGARARRERWSTEVFVRRLVALAFFAATGLLVAGALVSSPVALAFLLLFPVTGLLCGLGGILAISR